MLKEFDSGTSKRGYDIETADESWISAYKLEGKLANIYFRNLELNIFNAWRGDWLHSECMFWIYHNFT